MKKIAIAMSGGVDSGVAAALLVKGGYQCTAFHMHLWSETVKDRSFVNKCCSTESLEVARKTAHQLGMPFHVIDFSQIFKKKVVDYFLEAYGNGLTPNPCVFCNKFIKFGELLNYVRKLGFDYLATGHYARTKSDTQNVIRNTQDVKRKTKKNVSRLTYHILRARDEQKDQSYFLYNLTQNQLAHILFPVGGYQKKEVVAMAKKWQLPVAHRPESQEICFLSENDYRPFLKRQIPQKIIPGEVVDVKDKIIGRHQGLPLYTIGQRHGFTLKHQIQTPVLPPYYVIRKNIKKNQLIVGFGKETERKEFEVRQASWLNPLTQNFLKCQVRIRHQGSLLGAKVEKQKTKLRVILDESERGVAPGQAVVFYQGEKVLGGGLIRN
ncbi:tRNA 2-thiouridine(34) synthase MnmA [Patescibacteria group bacterium]|nr:tRNA 2-thiouridine(34) synthase MnmA [Patescibacteria group bacterium]